jgi:neprilysin
MKRFVLIFLAQILISKCESSDKVNYCTTVSCVHSAATLLTNLDNDVDPCDNFYDFACGNFVELIPDEKASVTAQSLVGERTYEQLVNLVTEPKIPGEPKTHRLSKDFYTSCMDEGEVIERSRCAELIACRFKI